MTHCPYCHTRLLPAFGSKGGICNICVNPECADATEHPLPTPCTLPADSGSAAVVAHASESSSGAGISPALPVDVPESDILWQYLSKGYSLNFVRQSLASGDSCLVREAEVIRDRVRKAWAAIRAEVVA